MFSNKKLIGFVAGVLLVGSVAAPVSASSLTSTQISAIIGLLQSFGADQSVIANVQATLGGQTPPPTGGYSPTNCPTLSRNLTVGVQGDDVTSLQNYLMTQGYLASGNNSGYFGMMTQAAVMKWQSAHSISAVGSVGPQTRAAMVCGNTSAPMIPAQPVAPAQPMTTPTVTNPISSGAVSVTSKSTFYVGIDNPIVISGTASGFSSLNLSFLQTEPINDVNIVATTTVSVVNGEWTYTLPQSMWWKQSGSGYYPEAGFTLAFFSPNDTNFMPSDSNPALAQQTISIDNTVIVASLTPNLLSGLDSAGGADIKSIDVAIYPITSISPYIQGSLVFSASNVPIGSACITPVSSAAPNCVVGWSVPVSPQLTKGSYYEIDLYSPKSHAIPLQQSSLVVSSN